jgi:hypothetical protein
VKKSTVAKIWWGGLAAIAGGLIVAAICVPVMLAFGGTFKSSVNGGSGYDFVPSFNAAFWFSVSFMVFGGLAAGLGAIAQFIAWIGALINSYRLPEKTWFVLLLILGIIGHVFGLVMMIVWLVAGPDGTKVLPPVPAAPAVQPGRVVPA